MSKHIFLRHGLSISTAIQKKNSFVLCWDNGLLEVLIQKLFSLIILKIKGKIYLHSLELFDRKNSLKCHYARTEKNRLKKAGLLSIVQATVITE